MADLTAEQRLRRKANLIRKLSFLDMHYTGLIEQLDLVIENINNLPPETPFITIDNELGKKYIACKLIVGNRDITDEFFGNDGEFTSNLGLCVEAFEAKKLQLLKEQSDAITHLQMLLSPELLPQFENFDTNIPM